MSIIIHHDGQFLAWSGNCDGPLTFGMAREEFEAYWKEEFGRRGMEGLPRLLDQAVDRGSTSNWYKTAEEATWNNRAGYRESWLPFSEIVRIFFVEQREPVEGEGSVHPDHEDDEDED